MEVTGYLAARVPSNPIHGSIHSSSPDTDNSKTPFLNHACCWYWIEDLILNLILTTQQSITARLDSTRSFDQEEQGLTNVSLV
jgi:hypothetical protein